jgi:hypothetical protein
LIEESIFESEMLYESQMFMYTFKETGDFILKVMNMTNVSLQIKVISDNLKDPQSYCNSKMDLSFMSAHSLSSFTPNDSYLKSFDHKMNRNRPFELVNFLCTDKTPSPEFCDYFGVKSSLIRKYQTLNLLIKGAQQKKTPETPTSSKIDKKDLLANIGIDQDLTSTSNETKDPNYKYLILLRSRFE